MLCLGSSVAPAPDFISPEKRRVHSHIHIPASFTVKDPKYHWPNAATFSSVVCDTLKIKDSAFIWSCILRDLVLALCLF